MIERPKRLQEVAALIRDGVSPEPETVRNFLGWFGAQRRGYYIVRGIRDALKEHGLVTVPDFESAFIDSCISFRGVDGAAPEPQPADVTVTPEGVSLSVEAGAVTVVTNPPSVITGGAVADPTYRIGKLSAANNPPISVQPDSSVREAVSLMLVHDFSQLPVMQSERDVKGIVRWDSIGARLALGCACDRVRDRMEPWQEIAADASLFAAIPAIVEHQYVLGAGP